MDKECVPCQNTTAAIPVENGADSAADRIAGDDVTQEKTDARKKRKREYAAGRYAKKKEEALWKEFIASEFYNPGATPEDTKKAFTAFKEKKAAEKKILRIKKQLPEKKGMQDIEPR